MKGQLRAALRCVAVLVTSATLGLAQVSGVSAPVNQPQNYAGTSYRSLAGDAPALAGPGTVNYIEGQAQLNGQPLSPDSTLRPGDLLQTAGGYVEILLTPGAFLRLGHATQARMLSAGLADTRVQLLSGTAILEVDQLVDGTQLFVQMSASTAQVRKTGLYSFDSAQQAVRVLAGELNVVTAAGTRTLGKDSQVFLASTKPLKKHKLDSNAAKAEPLYVWSQVRSQEEAQMSYQASQDAANYAPAGPGWFWDPYTAYYGFWPADGFLYSPFGWGFYSPAYFGFYGGGYYGGGYYSHPIRGYGGGWHGHGFQGGGGFHSGGGGGAGFHGGGGGFHGGGGGGHR
jgi:uncharacterized membrane protein YgcG